MASKSKGSGERSLGTATSTNHEVRDKSGSGGKLRAYTRDSEKTTTFVNIMAKATTKTHTSWAAP